LRTLGDIVGFLLIILGVLFSLGGCVVSSINSGGGLMLWIGIAMIAVGWVISNAASKKTCPQCSESVKYKALKCKHCGQEFGAAPRSSASEPFFK
jgi:predicted RNA-binding Zn-ribbon protein involved in translation (DUF1610 family)